MTVAEPTVLDFSFDDVSEADEDRVPDDDRDELIESVMDASAVVLPSECDSLGVDVRDGCVGLILLRDGVSLCV